MVGGQDSFNRRGVGQPQAAGPDTVGNNSRPEARGLEAALDWTVREGS